MPADTPPNKTGPFDAPISKFLEDAGLPNTPSDAPTLTTNPDAPGGVRWGNPPTTTAATSTRPADVSTFLEDLDRYRAALFQIIKGGGVCREDPDECPLCIAHAALGEPAITGETE